MTVPTRLYSSPLYRYGFQGQEKDDEIKGEGNSINYKYRMHDPRVGRFFAVDPLTWSYPELTPYQFSSNNPIGMVEIEGLEGEWKVDIQTAQKDMEIALDNGASHEEAKKVFRQTMDYLQPLRKMPDESAYLIGGFLGGTIIVAIGTEVVGGIILNEIKDELLSISTNGASDYFDLSKGLWKLSKKARKRIPKISNLISKSNKLVKNVNLNG